MVMGMSKTIKVKNVLQVLMVKKKLFLIIKLLIHGCKMKFNMNRCFIKTIEEKLVTRETRDRNLYINNYKRFFRLEVVAFVKFPSNKEKVDI